jgi:hypothetical protein
MLQRLTLTAAVSVCLLVLDGSPACGQLTRGEANRLAVDVLTLHVGGDVRGVLLHRTDTEIQIAVRRDWLAEHQPALLQALPSKVAAAPQLQLVERIDAWLAELKSAVPKKNDSPENQPANGPDNSDAAELLRVLKAERDTYRQYVDDPLTLPPGEGTTQSRQQAYRQLADRLDTWIGELEGTPLGAKAADVDRVAQNRDELIRILEQERATFAGKNVGEQPDGEAQFVRLTLSRADIRQIFAQSDVRRKLAIAALQQKLNDVESTPLPQLQRDLAARNIDWQNNDADASQLVGGGMLQNDREWAARQAIYEYQFLRRLDFQGTGNVLVQTGEEAPPPNLARLMQGMLDQQRAAALGDLLEEPIFTGLDFGGLGAPQDPQSGLKQATRTADRLGVRGVRITRMTPDLARKQSTVEDRFLAKMPDGSWETIWSVTKATSARSASQNEIDRVKQDPQVKQIIGLAEGLGLGGAQLDVALQFGAATMNAQKATDDDFYEFRDRYTKRLDGPSMSWE